MIIESNLKAWGNSVGLVVPKKELKESNLKVGDTVKVEIKKKTNPLREVFGKLKSKGDTWEELQMIRKELKSKYD